MNSCQVLRHNRTVAEYFFSHAPANSSSAPSAALPVDASYVGLIARLIASWSRRDVSRNVLPIRWMMQVCTIVSGHTFATTSGSPFRPSQIRKNTSVIRRLLVDRGVHLIENLFLDEVADQAVTEGLFVCLPLRITGATGSWVRPVLIT